MAEGQQPPVQLGNGDGSPVEGAPAPPPPRERPTGASRWSARSQGVRLIEVINDETHRDAFLRRHDKPESRGVLEAGDPNSCWVTMAAAFNSRTKTYRMVPSKSIIANELYTSKNMTAEWTSYVATADVLKEKFNEMTKYLNMYLARFTASGQGSCATDEAVQEAINGGRAEGSRSGRGTERLLLRLLEFLQGHSSHILLLRAHQRFRPSEVSRPRDACRLHGRLLICIECSRPSPPSRNRGGSRGGGGYSCKPSGAGCYNTPTPNTRSRHASRKSRRHLRSEREKKRRGSYRCTWTPPDLLVIKRTPEVKFLPFTKIPRKEVLRKTPPAHRGHRRCIRAWLPPP